MEVIIREIKTITIHCSDSDIIAHDNIAVIKAWHTDPPPNGRGWKDVGYHFFIRQNGTIEVGRPISIIPCSAKNHNANTVAICLSGRKDFSLLQFKSAAKLCQDLLDIFGINRKNIFPHNYFNPNKSCPNFNIEYIVKLIPN